MMPVLNDTVPTYVATLAEARALFGIIAGAPAEIAVIAYLAKDRRLVGLEYVVGTSDSVEVAPRRVVAGVLRHDASRVVIAHNHPSGDPRPSSTDVAHARRLAQALQPIDVRFDDQLILTRSATTSLRVLGLL